MSGFYGSVDGEKEQRDCLCSVFNGCACQPFCQSWLTLLTMVDSYQPEDILKPPLL